MGHTRPQTAKFVLFWSVTWAFLLGLWLLFVSELKISELLAGAAAAAIAATAVAVVEGQRFAQFSPKARWLALFLTEPWYVLEGTAAIFWALLRHVAGRGSEAQLRAIRFDAGGEDDESAARRAVAIALTTIPPNFIVIGIDRSRDLMLIHQVSPSGTPWVAKEVGAQG